MTDRLSRRSATNRLRAPLSAELCLLGLIALDEIWEPRQASVMLNGMTHVDDLPVIGTLDVVLTAAREHQSRPTLRRRRGPALCRRHNAGICTTSLKHRRTVGDDWRTVGDDWRTVGDDNRGACIDRSLRPARGYDALLGCRFAMLEVRGEVAARALSHPSGVAAGSVLTRRV